MQFPLCRHVKTNGRQCQSPALDQSVYCYFHDHLHRRHSGFRHAKTTQNYLVPGQHIELSPLEDRESVQLAISTVVNALATGQLETRRATANLYGLQLASHNAGHLNTEPYAANIVLTVQPSPDGLDLAEPGAVIDIADTSAEDYNADEEDDDEDEEDDEDNDEADDAAPNSVTVKACEEYSASEEATQTDLRPRIEAPRSAGSHSEPDNSSVGTSPASSLIRDRLEPAYPPPAARRQPAACRQRSRRS